jgi:hypothetical protein
MIKKSLLLTLGIILLEIFSLSKCGSSENAKALKQTVNSGSQNKLALDTAAHLGPLKKDRLHHHS